MEVLAHRPTDILYVKLGDGTKWLVDTECRIRSWKPRKVSWKELKDRNEAKAVIKELKKDFTIENIDKLNKRVEAASKPSIILHLIQLHGYEYLIDLKGRVKKPDWDNIYSRWKEVENIGEANKIISELSAAYPIDNIEELERDIGSLKVHVRTNPKTQARYRHIKELLRWYKDQQKCFFTGKSLKDVPAWEITFHHKNFDHDDNTPDNLTLATNKAHKAFHLSVYRKMSDAVRQKEKVPTKKPAFLKWFKGKTLEHEGTTIQLADFLQDINENQIGRILKYSKNYRDYKAEGMVMAGQQFLEWVGRKRRKRNSGGGEKIVDTEHQRQKTFLEKTGYKAVKIGDTIELEPPTTTVDKAYKNAGRVNPRGPAECVKRPKHALQTKKQLLSSSYHATLQDDFGVSSLNDLDNSSKKLFFDIMRKKWREKKRNKTYVEGLDGMDVGDERVFGSTVKEMVDTAVSYISDNPDATREYVEKMWGEPSDKAWEALVNYIKTEGVK